MTMKAVWITWERQQRNRSMARELGLPLHEIDLRCGRLERYVRSVIYTYRVLMKERPETVFFQNPSVVLGLFLVMMRKLRRGYRFAMVGDFHNGAVQGPLLWLNRLIARQCQTVIVSNDRLGALVREWGAEPFSLPDPLPDLGEGLQPRPQPPFVVLFICSWAEDEPVEEVLAAAEALPRHVEVAVKVTGRPKRSRVPSVIPSNVELLGFLPHEDFIAELNAAHAVMDLTTRADCMVCGAYEGLALGKPLILSGNEPTMDWFGRAAAYCFNDKGTIAESIRQVVTDYSTFTLEADAARARVRREFEDLKRSLLERVFSCPAGGAQPEDAATRAR